jgi:hypothetical protein
LFEKLTSWTDFVGALLQQQQLQQLGKIPLKKFLKRGRRLVFYFRVFFSCIFGGMRVVASLF